jgi:hypothetical protein
MRTIQKTTKKILIEITSDEMNIHGFDRLWDDIRAVYPVEKFDVESAIEISEGKLIIIELRRVYAKSGT